MINVHTVSLFHANFLILISIIWNLWIKNKVRELFTGKNKIEEWKLLPLQQVDRHNLDVRMFIDKNFVAINFQRSRILIVNLVSRKNFLIEIDALENQIK